MAATESRLFVQPGDPAPGFVLPSVQHEGVVSLDDYRGKSPLLLVILRGLYCAFCRRHLAQLGVTREKLREVGVDTLAIVASPVERARLYARFRPIQVPLAADPEMVTHRVYGVPTIPATPELAQRLKSMYLDLAREMNQPLSETASMPDVVNTVGRLDGFEMTDADWDDRRRHMGQLVAQFLVDRQGVVRWINVENDGEGPAGLGRFPTDDDLLKASLTLPR